MERTHKFDSYFKKKMAHTNSLHIVVTHGFYVVDFGYKNGARKSYANYCAITGIEIKGKKSRLFLDNSCQHFSQNYP